MTVSDNEPRVVKRRSAIDDVLTPEQRRIDELEESLAVAERITLELTDSYKRLHDAYEEFKRLYEEADRAKRDYMRLYEEAIGRKKRGRGRPRTGFLDDPFLVHSGLHADLKDGMPVREAAKNYRVSKSTVQRELAKLVASGDVEQRGPGQKKKPTRKAGDGWLD